MRASLSIRDKVGISNKEEYKIQPGHRDQTCSVRLQVIGIIMSPTKNETFIIFAYTVIKISVTY